MKDSNAEPSNNSSWEVVHHVSNFWDFPVEGLADLNGVPHAFFVQNEIVMPSEDPEENNIQVVYALYPVPEKVVVELMEQQDIFERWHQAWSQDRENMKHHHPLPSDRPRYDELKDSLSRQMDAIKLSVSPEVRTGKFLSSHREVTPGSSRWRSYGVKWKG